MGIRRVGERHARGATIEPFDFSEAAAAAQGARVIIVCVR
jgi:hypothetical protein